MALVLISRGLSIEVDWEGGGGHGLLSTLEVLAQAMHDMRQITYWLCLRLWNSTIQYVCKASTHTESKIHLAMRALTSEYNIVNTIE